MYKNLSAALLLGIIAATSAQAAEYTYTPYVGADYAFTNAVVKGTRPSYNGINFNFGTKYNDYFGTELFFQQTTSDSKNTAIGKYKSSYRAYGLDIAAYLPLSCYHTFDFVATAGVGEYVLNKKITPQKHHNDSGIGYRLGGGFMYNMTENISIRALARYIGTDKISSYDHMVEYSLGLRYHFL